MCVGVTVEFRMAEKRITQVRVIVQVLSLCAARWRWLVMFYSVTDTRVCPHNLQ